MEPVQEKKEDRRVRRAKKLLMQALTELMQQKQLKEITVKELTDLADMNRGTFYLYYRDIFDMLEKIEDQMIEGLDHIVSLQEGEEVARQARPILLKLFRFIGENQEICRVLLSPNGDMSFLHRLNDILREKCLQYYKAALPATVEEEFDYHYSFIVFGTAGMIRAWVARECQETPEQMAELAESMMVRGSIP